MTKTYMAVNADGAEYILNFKPIRGSYKWAYIDKASCMEECVLLPKGSIEKLMGKKITWKDEPIVIEIEDIAKGLFDD